MCLVTIGGGEGGGGGTVTTAMYLLNRMPSKVLDFKTLLQVLSTHVSLLTMLMLPPRIFGCVVFVHLHKY